MLTKWWWRFLLEESALCRKVIVSIHGNCEGFKTDSHTPYKSGPWYQVLKMKDDLSPYGISPLSLFKKKVGNGQTTRFWIDPWLGGPPLRCTFPRLYRLELNPECLICDRAPQSLNNIGSSNVALPTGNVPSFVQDHLISPHATSIRGQTPSRPPNEPPGLVYQWAWSRTPWTSAEQQEITELMTLLSNFCLSNDNDSWECTISKSRFFSVKDMRSHISKHVYTSNPQPYRWNSVIPIKINICSWRIIHERLPTRSNLNQRGIDLYSILCLVCDSHIETEEHLFVSCEVAKEIWSKVLSWWKIRNISITCLPDAINLADRVQMPNHLVAFFDA
ncbi:RNA-directed DNA polymerase, eukaryota, reverse transcriptase zinc-binding domain protein, partial [Tanacetum coccineum]